MPANHAAARRIAHELLTDVRPTDSVDAMVAVALYAVHVDDISGGDDDTPPNVLLHDCYADTLRFWLDELPDVRDIASPLAVYVAFRKAASDATFDDPSPFTV